MRQPKKRPFFVRIVRMLFHYWRYFFSGLIPTWRWFYFTRLSWWLPISARKKHGYIVAGSGSGKSELIKVLILSHLKQRERKETVFLLDPHGDIAEQTALFREHKSGKNLVYLSPNLDPQKTFCINPFDISPDVRADPQQLQFMTECLTEVFKEIVGSDSHLSSNMETLLKAVLSVLLKREGSTLLTLQQFMRDEENQELVEYAIHTSTAGNRHFFSSAFYDRSLTPTKNALYTKIQSLLTSETFYRLTIGKSTVNIAELMDSKKTVVFNLSKGLIGQQTSPAFGRFIMGMIQGYSFARQSIPEHQRTPVFVYLDEFQNFITPSIETLLAESRKYAVHLTLAQQFHGQGTSPALRGAILNNTAVKIAGRGEGSSLEAIQKVMIGASKEALQNLEKGYFFLKVQPETIAQQHLTENLAQKIRVTTAFLGNRNRMKPQQWQKVKALQTQNYYKPLKCAVSDANKPADEDYQKINAAAHNQNKSLLRPVKPALKL